MERLLNIEEASNLTGFSKWTLMKWMKEGSLSYQKIGRSVRFFQSELEKTLANKSITINDVIDSRLIQ